MTVHRTPSRIEALPVYVPDPRYASIRLDANEAPPLLPTLDPSERAALNDALAFELSTYPDVRAKKLRAACATKLSVDPESLVFGVGSDEIILMLLMALDGPVLIPKPTFVMYAHSARVLGREVVEVALNHEGDLDLPSMLETMRQVRPALVFLASPNNPTANVYSLDAVVAIAELAAETNTFVVLDEAYLPFRLGPADPWSGVTALELRENFPHLLCLRTLSKVGLAAIRLGYLVGPPALVQNLERVRLPYNLPTPTQAIGALAFTTLAPAVARHVATIQETRRITEGALRMLPWLNVGSASANFFWLGCERAGELFTFLADRSILVRHFPKIPDRIRVTVGSEAEMQEFCRLMADFGSQKA